MGAKMINDNAGAVSQAMGSVTSSLSGQAQTDMRFGQDLNQGLQSVSRSVDKISQIQDQADLRSANATIANGKLGLIKAQNAMNSATTLAEVNKSQLDYNNFSQGLLKASKSNSGHHYGSIESSIASNTATLSGTLTRRTGQIGDSMAYSSVIDTLVKQNDSWSQGNKLSPADIQSSIDAINPLLGARYITGAQKSKLAIAHANLVHMQQSDNLAPPTNPPSLGAPTALHTDEDTTQHYANTAHLTALLTGNKTQASLFKMSNVIHTSPDQQNAIQATLSGRNVFGKLVYQNTAASKKALSIIKRQPQAYIQAKYPDVAQKYQTYQRTQDLVDYDKYMQAYKTAGLSEGIPTSTLIPLPQENSAPIDQINSDKTTDTTTYTQQVLGQRDNITGGLGEIVGGSGANSNTAKAFNYDRDGDTSKDNGVFASSFQKGFASKVHKEYKVSSHKDDKYAPSETDVSTVSDRTGIPEDDVKQAFVTMHQYAAIHGDSKDGVQDVVDSVNSNANNDYGYNFQVDNETWSKTLPNNNLSLADKEETVNSATTLVLTHAAQVTGTNDFAKSQGLNPSIAKSWKLNDAQKLVLKAYIKKARNSLGDADEYQLRYGNGAMKIKNAQGNVLPISRGDLRAGYHHRDVIYEKSIKYVDDVTRFNKLGGGIL